MTDSEPAHPNPQLQRRRWTSLDGPGAFSTTTSALSPSRRRSRAGSRTIEVPFPPESEASGIGDRGFHPCCWYQRDFELHARRRAGDPALRRGRLLRPASGSTATLAATHEGGHTPFWADITALLDPSGRQTRDGDGDDDPHDLTKPRGKQDWQLEPHAIWYPRTTGIWQTVWLERVGRTYVDKIRWTPHVESYAHRLRGARRRRSGRRPRDRGDAAPRRAAARARPLPGHRRRGRSHHRPLRSRHRRLPQRAAVEPRAADPARRDGPAAARRHGDRRVHVVHGAALGHDPARPLHAERPALPAAHGARPGLLARHADGGAERRRAPAGRRAGQGDGLQRRAQAPEDREPALPLLGRPARPDGLGGDAVGVPLHAHRDQAHGARVERGDRARLQPSLHRRLGAVQRVVGRARADQRRRRSATRSRRSTT